MGILGGYRVVDVQIKNGVITHTVDISAGDCCIMGKEEAQTEKNADGQITGMECVSEKAELAAGGHVHGKIDWQHRFTICSNTVESTFFGNCPPQIWI